MNILSLPRMFLLCFIFVLGFGANAQTNLNLYYGLLHSHTLFSDGSGTPEEAYQAAKDAGLNFFAITEHNHDQAEAGASAERRDGILIATNHELYNGTNPIHITRHVSGTPENLTVKSVQSAAKLATSTTFLALYGQEFSTISSGNHMNVFNIPDVLTIPKGEFKSLYDFIGAQADPNIILQMNHPDVHGDMFGNGANNNDYGIDEPALGTSFAEFATNVDKHIQLIEVLSGPAMAEHNSPTYHYPHVHENDYFFYLKQGLHIAPSAGQDNHYKTWGSSSSARIGVYATALSKEGIADAIRHYRTFATEDKNLSLTFTINDAEMGSMISATEGQHLKLKMSVKDADETGATYTAYLYGGAIQPTTYADAKEVHASDGKLEEKTRTGNGTVEFSDIISTNDPQFYYIKIEEQDGDRAWSAPIWINYSESGQPIVSNGGTTTTDHPLFYWTKSASSQVYHKAGCSSIAAIKPENLMSGTAAPTGRHQHECHIQEEDGH